MSDKYKKNYLSDVIVRMDYFPISAIEKDFNSELEKEILALFPINELKKGILKSVQISNDSLSSKDKQFIHRIYHNSDRTKTLEITSENIDIVYKKYTTYLDLKRDFLTVVNVLFKLYGSDIKVQRLGLRYINQVSLNEPDPFGWDEYLDENLLSIFQLTKEKSHIIRGFSSLELDCEDVKIIFNFGVHNTGYPARVKKKNFILDFDAYLEENITKEQVELNLERFHEEIIIMFEKMIKDPLRGKMNE